ncbi:class I SAM-dependent methyltransferase [Actinomadura parmotrematis]|uniref:Class I SAM-dependent methyltransferase n=1 Tax=Actinomadura parmotrematis TaxID=2864039 RepID=A0ABS7FQB0_9ACTN|nr:class I SAM-dependent methyltransferase [Actinomadura parmotrematis]MBW8482569.1 class I SAM-dependent methyltransferase [Actinomadura parmotrematis]
MRVELTGVPETLLWNLYQRAAAARGPRPVLEDPRAVELVEEIDYPFGRFGGTAMAPWHALRVRTFDRAVRRFLDRCPDGQVVALGEGLETQFWRVDNGRVRWLTVDLPETLDVRERLLPGDPPRRRSLACSALDLRWTDEVDASRGVLVTAQGPLMYLEPPEVRGLLAACAQTLPGGAMVFDAVPPLLARGTASRAASGAASGAGGAGYRAPAWRWTLPPRAWRRVATASPAIASVRSLAYPRGRGLYALAPLAGRVPLVRDLRMSILELRFAS